jgi:glycosyltransferase involved in cell wall biosynthesis
VAAGFVAPFTIVLRELLGTTHDDDELARAIHAIYRFFLEHDFDTAFRSRAVWDSFSAQVADVFPLVAERRGYPSTQASLADLTAGLGWLYHWFFPLSQPLPHPDVVHTAMVGSCTLIAAAVKLEHGSPFLLSEHGIYLRERYLAEHASSASLFRKLLLLGFARRMTELGYSLADAVSPCCDYNRRWELRNGAKPEMLETAYYGLEPRPPTAARPAGGPIVVWAGRIDPLKDLETLLRSAALVLQARPDVRFRLFGSAEPGREWYSRRCLGLHRELALGEGVRFEGFRADTAAVIAEADLVVLSSISEGFPFITLEAMHSGKPVVSTAVGGVCEQVPASCGITVEPRDPKAFAEAILSVLDDPDACAQKGRAALERAESLFSAEQFRATHRALYEQLANGNPTNSSARAGARLQLAPPQRAPVPASAEQTRGRDALANELAGRISQPIDPLELAAVIESHGITDTVAHERYGAESTFDLAERIFASVMAQRPSRPAGLSERAHQSRRATRGRVSDLARGPFALVPLLVLLCTVQAFAEVGWDRGRLLALSLGMTVSVALVNGFVSAIGRRVALYLGLDYRRLAGKLLTAGFIVAASTTTILGALAYALASALDVFAADERLVFLVSLVCCTGLGFLIAKLSLARATGWVCVGLGAGVGAVLVTRHFAGWGTSGQLLVALSIGLGVAVAVMFAAGRYVYRARDDHTTLPPRAQLVFESAWYFAYGVALMAFLLEVHILGWLGAKSATESRLDTVAALEVGLTLALPPVILASGVAERTLRLFWLYAREQQEHVTARRARRYGQALQAFYHRRLFVYLVSSAALAAAMLVVFELALRSGRLGEWVALPNPQPTELVFVASLVAFWLVGWAQFNCMFVLNFGRPEQAFRPVLLAMVVAGATGIPLGRAGFGYTVLAFAAGSGAFAWASSRNCRRVLAAADHYYATAF